ncbi:hypothetical protein [Amycolatopsis sp. FDAARGOS 1241]|uniref:hypothetical protein n=1 Tax=Amycolatopsis sp. FDAARGOS 1241 TaxID=2778070 RepID=UPI00194E13B5|nr:hypothetical protein [Amycolatopsis sp. FDAARGOS 1241]QRP48331.1 hypothetical protein I6J71_11015 [Amycolatopsis sp. FDAARGOS 1241]
MTNDDASASCAAIVDATGRERRGSAEDAHSRLVTHVDAADVAHRGRLRAAGAAGLADQTGGTAAGRPARHRGSKAGASEEARLDIAETAIAALPRPAA